MWLFWRTYTYCMYVLFICYGKASLVWTASFIQIITDAWEFSVGFLCMPRYHFPGLMFWCQHRFLYSSNIHGDISIFTMFPAIYFVWQHRCAHRNGQRRKWSKLDTVRVILEKNSLPPPSWDKTTEVKNMENLKFVTKYIKKNFLLNRHCEMQNLMLIPNPKTNLRK